MFNSLSEKLGRLADRLRGTAHISDADLDKILRELRLTLLEADVALPVVRHLLDLMRERAAGAEVAKSLKPGQVIVKILHDALVEILGKEQRQLDTSGIPTVILLAGLQGAGKTTTAGKLARYLTARGKKVALTSVDATRPAAREQLQILADQVNVPYMEGRGSTAVAMATSALDETRRQGLHVLILDTAGRQVVDEALMTEISGVSRAVQANERLIVLDAMTGQTALTIAEQFHAALDLSGSILTKADAEARGGAALSLAHSTGVPVRFLGVGEKIGALEVFDPKRMAGRILGQGDIVGLVEKVQEHVDVKEAKKLAKKAGRVGFDLMDFANQLGQMQKMGGMGEMLKMLPGMRLPEKALAEVDEKPLKQMQAIVFSMTQKERRYPKTLNGSRKRRIAAGSGTSVQQVNQMLKQFTQMQRMMKKMKGSKGKRMMAQLAGKFGGMGGMPGMPKM
ncbi:MAG: signal recognition particle protein [Mariprofundaceae bacterium]